MIKKQILEQVIADLNSNRGRYCQIKHKRGWLEYLDHGELTFSPQELHQTLHEVIDCDEGRPRGQKLFHLRKRFGFTMMADKKPKRPEEALERFIVVSNGDNFFGQIPIGGGKESIDIGIQESSRKFTFIELKPWRNKNSPLYAIVESLKNLIEYRLVIKHGIQDIPIYKTIDLMVLAPIEYYRVYGLQDGRNKSLMEKLTKDFGREFQTGISLMAVDIDEQVFLDKCKRIYDTRGLKGQQVVEISEVDAMPQLARDKWKPMAPC